MFSLANRITQPTNKYVNTNHAMAKVAEERTKKKKRKLTLHCLSPWLSRNESNTLWFLFIRAIVHTSFQSTYGSCPASFIQSIVIKAPKDVHTHAHIQSTHDSSGVNVYFKNDDFVSPSISRIEPFSPSSSSSVYFEMKWFHFRWKSIGSASMCHCIAMPVLLKWAKVYKSPFWCVSNKH